MTEIEEQQDLHLEAQGKALERIWDAVDVVIPHSFGTSVE